MKVYYIPEDFVFSPCKVDGLFWSNFHNILSYLGQPEELVKIKENEPEKYEQIVGPLLQFISATEEELFQKGFLKEKELSE